MNVYEITSASLRQHLAVDEVPEVFVVMAKHQVLGLGADQVADTLGVDLADILAAETDELYIRIKEFVAGVHAQQTANQTSGWDAIESIAMDNLLKRLPV